MHPAYRIRKYVQPKRHPSAPEVALICLGQNVLLFHSTNQAPGHRFNFCTQICSDFLVSANVSQLRRELLQVVRNLPFPLDSVFVLQCQDEPGAIQFSQGTKAYFERTADLIETADGCVVFANNANPKHGKSQTWGQSQFRFRYELRWPSLDFPSPTFFLFDERGHDYQAVILRESGPSLYHLVYKPRYLVNPGPVGQCVPFPKEQALWSPVLSDGFCGQFARILPVCHWLRSEWLEGCADLANEVRAGGINHEVGRGYLPSHGRCIHSWNKIVGESEPVARTATDLYFSCWKRHDDYPPKCREPKRWHPAASQGAKRMMQACALVGLALRAYVHEEIAWAPTETIHAVVNGKMGIVFLWGGGAHSAKAMIEQYRNLQEHYGLADLLAPVSLVVLVDARGSVPADCEGQLITRTTSPFDAQHLRPPGGVVVATQTHRQVYVSDNDLYGPLYNSATLAELTGGLSRILTDKGL